MTHRSVWPSWPLSLTGQVLASTVLFVVFLLIARQWMLADVSAYYGWSASIVQDAALPYRDFPYEYPPLSFIALLVPQYITTIGGLSIGVYVVIFAAFMGLLAIDLSGVMRLITRLLERDGSSAPDGATSTRQRRYLLLMLLAMPLLLVRFDVLAILCTALALYYAVAGRPGLSGVTLGLGIGVKLYPALLLPLFAAHWWHRQGWRASLIHTASAMVTALIAFLIFLIFSPEGLLEALRFQGNRGLQIETVAGGVIQLVDAVSAGTHQLVLKTTLEIDSPAARGWLAIQPAVAIALVGLVATICVIRIRRAHGETHGLMVLTATSIAMLLTFMVTSRVLSPQNIFWLLPFAALLTGFRYRLVLAAMAATVAVFPLLYDALIAQEPGAILLLNVRNALLLAIGVILLVAPAPAIAGARD